MELKEISSKYLDKETKEKTDEYLKNAKIIIDYLEKLLLKS